MPACKKRDDSAPHRSRGKGNSANFACTEFSEVRLSNFLMYKAILAQLDRDIVKEITESSSYGGCAPSLSPQILEPLVLTGAGSTSYSAPPRERWIALRKTVLLLASMAVAMILAFLYGCQADKQGESHSSKTTAQSRAAEEAGQAQGGDVAEAQGELGPKVSKIMSSSFYRYGEWGY